MAKINRYKLKDGITKENLIKLGFQKGGGWITDSTTLFKSYYYKYKTLEVDINIGFTDDIYNWNDFDNILILDEDFCQAYTPIYHNFGKETTFECAVAVINQYNKIMDELPILERIS